MDCSDIRKCMFCGNGNGDCHLHKVDFGPGRERLEKTKYHVVCTGCAAMGPLAETPERAISWWAEPMLDQKYR